MNRPRIGLVVLVITLIAALGAWGVRARIRAARQSAGPPAGATRKARPASPTPTSTPATTAQRYRLAGVAMGRTTFVVVEAPDGSTALYHRGESVPGLGRVEGVEPDAATFVGAEGTVRLRVAGLPTATPTTPAKPTATRAAEAPTPPTLPAEPPARTAGKPS